MFNQEITNLMPGMGPTGVVSYKRLWLGDRQNVRYLPGGGVIDGANARDPSNLSTQTSNMTSNVTNYDTLEAGLMMGKLSTGKYAPSAFGVTAAALTTIATSLSVGVPASIEILRRVGASGNIQLVGPPSTAGTVAVATVAFSAVNTSTGVLAITATGTAFAVGSLVQPSDASNVIRTFTDAEDGIHVTFEGSNYDIQFPRIPVAGGVVDIAGLTFYSSCDASVKTYIKTALKAVGPFVFSDDL
jgi:hypothetical protein